MKLTTIEIIKLLLNLCEDLKMKVFSGTQFETLQLPTLNSILKAIENQECVLPLTNEEFDRIIIHKTELTWIIP